MSASRHRSTVIHSADAAPPGILLWRALAANAWRIVFIVTAIALLADAAVGGMQIFRTRKSSDTSEKVLPARPDFTASARSIWD